MFAFGVLLWSGNGFLVFVFDDGSDVYDPDMSPDLGSGFGTLASRLLLTTGTRDVYAVLAAHWPGAIAWLCLAAHAVLCARLLRSCAARRWIAVVLLACLPVAGAAFAAAGYAFVGVR